jgi:HAD superfamily hydrolase (TIGR01509 family)
MALDAIIFDVDGTLVDSNALHIDAFVRAFASHDYKIEPDRIAIEMGKGGDNLVPSIIGPSADKKDGDAIRNQQPKEFSKLAEQHGLPLFPGTRALLSEVRRRGLKIIIATSSGKAQLKTLKKFSGLDLEAESDELVNADDTKVSKPAPDLVIAAVKKSNLSPAQCVMIGDTPYDAESAKHAGVICLGLLCGGQNSAETLLTAGARRIYTNPADILSQFDQALTVASPGPAHLTQKRMEELMQHALKAASDGMSDGEVPIGCCLARGDGSIIATGYNRLNKTQNKTAHAEIITFANSAGKVPTDARDLILISTLEPCVMCTGAAMEAAVDTIIYALRAPSDAGTARVKPPQSPESQMPRIVGDVLAEQSLDLLKKWYKKNKGTPQSAYIEQLLTFHHAL